MQSWDRVAPEGGSELPLLRIRPMRGSDLVHVLAIERVSFPSPWRRAHFEHELYRNPYSINRVAEAASRVGAYACAWCVDEELALNNIAVDPQLRGRGLGAWFLTALLREAVDLGCRAAMLEVRPSNEPARRLYRGLGFVETGRRANYYGPEGEDAIVMTRTLGPGLGSVAPPSGWRV